MTYFMKDALCEIYCTPTTLLSLLYSIPTPQFFFQETSYSLIGNLLINQGIDGKDNTYRMKRGIELIPKFHGQINRFTINLEQSKLRLNFPKK